MKKSPIFQLCLFILIAALSARAEAPGPYSAALAPSVLASASSIVRATHKTPDKFTPLPAQRWTVRTREFGALQFVFTRKRDRSWSAYRVRQNSLTPVPLGDTTLLRGYVELRQRGQRIRRPATATLASSHNGNSRAFHVDETSVLIHTELPRRSGEKNFYTITISTDRNPSVSRVPASAATNRACGNLPRGYAAPGSSPGVTLPLIAHSAQRPPTLAGVTYREVKVAAIVDFQYYTAAGGNSTAVSNQIAALMNSVSAIFERDLGVTITLSTIYIYSAAGDPYTTSDAEQLLLQIETNVGTYGSADIYHLLTGRNIYGVIGGTPNYSVVGLAYLAQVCTTSGFPYSVTEKFNPSLDYVTIAHELGHNFGANHDSQTSPTTIMFPSLPVSQVKFSGFSQGEILNNYLRDGFYNFYPGPGATPTPISLDLRSGCLPEVTKEATPTPTATSTATPSPTATPAPELPSLTLSGALNTRGVAQLSVSLAGALSASCTSFLDIAPDSRFRQASGVTVDLGSGDIAAFTLSGRINRRAIIPRGRSSAKAFARVRYVCPYGTATSPRLELRADRVRTRQSVPLTSWITRLAQAIS